MEIKRDLLNDFYNGLDERSREALDSAVSKVVETKKRGGKVAVVTGSGPNLHEGVTTLIAELMEKGVVDGVTTSSAVINHEMSGSLDRVKMCDASRFGLDRTKMPRGNVFEFTELAEEDIDLISKEMIIDRDLLEKGKASEGRMVIKAAGNMAYPMGLRTEKIAEEILSLSRQSGLPFETIAGWGCDSRTMLGMGAEKGLPVLVTIPQMVGGGHVGLAVGDSIPVAERSRRIADMLGAADVIIESAVALTQEIHDGPFETYTGHGIWSWWQGQPVFSLEGKTLIRFDLDENLRLAQDLQKNSSMIQEAIDKGLPKTKISKIPFRMEMSAFARHEGSIPVIGDIGMIWPVFALRIADELGIELDFISYKQETEEGREMREWIVKNVKFLNREKMLKKFREWNVNK
ncbi:MAG: hypothetical protein GX056_03640 [Synergistaceae bacterium]|jgi:hypothetical protein|nr:hypothetical protein [Synergistaceae bacterium]MCK9435769.1 hypothetical protein [Synergistaceae bacterium]MDD2350355.1 hypothetical protein [Synergistaceae bacterium]MDD3318905.1 hypothetical protein [Synergistaceae bacterium]MDD3672162.1 hypothetical protein [Synergistaceae bacterium]